MVCFWALLMQETVVLVQVEPAEYMYGMLDFCVLLFLFRKLGKFPVCMCYILA